MLSGHMTAHDEDEVEDELAALEAEMAPPQTVQEPIQKLPAPPSTDLSPRVRAEQEQEEEARRPERQAMLAS